MLKRLGRHMQWGGTRLRWVAVWIALLLGARLALAFPDPAPQWLSIKGTGGSARASAYYAQIGAPATLAAWKTAYGFTGTDEIRATYYNAGDLGFGREMHCRAAMFVTACYVVNHALGPGAPAGRSLDGAINNQETLATVAMVYRSLLVGQQQRVEFFIYDTQTGQRLNSVPLDSQGQKFVPFLCLACHGGTTPVTDTQVVNASFLPFDVASFQYSAQPGYTRADQQEAFRQLNALVRGTNPPSVMAQLIDGWYAPGSVNTPGSTFHDSYVAPGYGANLVDVALYTQVVKHYCRSCHIAQGYDLASAPQVDAARSYVFDQYLMPHAELTNHNFWASGAPAYLADNRGWSLRVTRTDDPSPNGCAPGDCSLREAVIAANADPDLSIITFAVNGTFRLTIPGNENAAAAGDLDITKDLTVLGTGPGQTIVDGNNQFRIINVLGGAKVVLQNVTLQHGSATCGAAIANDSSTLTLNFSVLRDNTATSCPGSWGGAGLAAFGGALTYINQSTIGPNNVSQGLGGGIYNGNSVIQISASTLSGNTAIEGGGFYNDSPSSAALIQDTVSFNHANSSGGGLAVSASSLSLSNSIVAGNTCSGCIAANECFFVSAVRHYSGVNLFGANGAGGGCAPGVNDLVPTGPLQAVLNATLAPDPVTGVLAHNLVPGSPAVDAVAFGPACAPPSYDARNQPRPLDGDSNGDAQCDIGAVEFAPQRLFLPNIHR